MMKLPLGTGWTRKLLAFGLLGVGVVFFSGVTLVNHYMERSLARALEKETRVAEGVSWRLAPLGLFDLLQGTTREVEFTASRLAFQEGPVLEDLRFASGGIRLDPRALWFEKRMQIRELAETVLAFRLAEEELTMLLRREWPEWEPCVYLTPGRVRITGTHQEEVLFEAFALLEQASENSLRLIPTGFNIGGLTVPAEFFRDYRQVLTWEFPVELPWPLRIEEFQVEEGYLRIKWREREEKG